MFNRTRIIGWLLALCLGLCSGAYAATVLIMLSDDSEAYRETATAIEQELGNRHKTARVLANRLISGAIDLSDVRLVLSIGVKATETASAHTGKIPLLAVLVPRDWHQKTGRSLLSGGGRNAGVIVLDQPYQRQF